MIKVCIFDLDGTLARTQASIARPVNMTLEHYGLQPQPVEAFNYFAGDGIKNALKRALIAAGDKEASHLEEGLPMCRAWMQEDPCYLVEPYDHMVWALKQLKKNGIQIAVFSNKPHASAISVVETIFGKGTFDYIQGQTDRIPIKPDPSGVFEILERFGADKRECLYFGDTNTDMKTGKNAGVKTVGVTWGFRPRAELEENEADIIIDSAREIPALAGIDTCDVVCIGMAIMDSMIKGFEPEPIDSGYRAASGSLNVGGDAVNEAIAAAKIGLKTGIMCNLGRDYAGNIISSELGSNGVSTKYVIRSDEHPTPVTTIFVQEDGNRRSITNRAHSYNFHPEQYKEQFTSTRAIIMGSLFRAPFNDPDVIHDVLTAATENDILVFADTKLPNFRKLTLKDISDVLPLIDYITPNLSEAEYYSGKTEVSEMADVFLEAGVRNVIIKMGEEGCYFKNKDGGFKVPAFRIEAVDATGAGDNFIAGFVSEILRGSKPEDALRFANACGAVCSTEVGAGTALKSRSQVEEFLKSHTTD